MIDERDIEFALWAGAINGHLLGATGDPRIQARVERSGPDSYGWCMTVCGWAGPFHEPLGTALWEAFHDAAVAAEPLRPVWLQPSRTLTRRLTTLGLGPGAN